MNPPPGDQTYHSRTTHGTLVDDLAIVRRVAERDEMALAMLYDRWVPQVYSLAMSMLHDADDAEDVVEDTFWQVWQRASSYDAARGTVSTWLLTIGRSRALDRLRAKQRQRGESLTDLAESATQIAPSDPLLEAEDADRRHVVYQALHTLPDDQRRALELAYFGGLSQSEIAEHLQQPLGTIKTRMRLGMQKLREQLGTFRGNGV